MLAQPGDDRGLVHGRTLKSHYLAACRATRAEFGSAGCWLLVVGTVISQIVNAFVSMLLRCDSLWSSAKVEEGGKLIPPRFRVPSDPSRRADFQTVQPLGNLP